MWRMFTFAMVFGTLKTKRVLHFVFMSLDILFFMLTTRELTGNTAIATLTGIEGIICGVSSTYLGLAEVLNESNQNTFLPIDLVKYLLLTLFFILNFFSIKNLCMQAKFYMQFEK